MKTALSLSILALAMAPARAIGGENGPTGSFVESLLVPELPSHYIGDGVAIDGTTAVVGAQQMATGIGFQPGVAYVFVQSGPLWEEQVRLEPSDGEHWDNFGRAVCISGDTIVVGSPQDDDANPSDDDCDSGSAYVFVRSGSTWTEQAKLTASDAAPGDLFGGNVAIHGDTAVVGLGQAAISGGPGLGAAYVFVRSGTVWTQQAKLNSSDQAVGDEFGRSLTIRDDTIVVGANRRAHSGLTGAGAVYVFQRSGATWSEQVRITPADANAMAFFGSALDLRGDTLLIGARLDNERVQSSGAAYVFVGAGASWSQEAKLKASDPEAGSYFGCAVGLDADRAVIGAMFDDEVADHGGSAYVFDRQAGSWSETIELVASDCGIWNRFGQSVGVDGETVLVGAPGHYEGQAYAYSPVPAEPGVGYCFGDPGSGIPCPCGNDNDGTVQGSGCDNGVFASGAHLSGSGVASVSADTLVLTTTRAEPYNSGLYFQGSSKVNFGNGSWFGDGLRCAGGAVVRLQVRFSDAAGTTSTTLSIAAKGAVAPGETRYYQCWYRNQSTPACGLGINEFNLSNGYEVLWLP